MHTLFQRIRPQVTSLRRLPSTDASRRASRQRHWNFTPCPSRLAAVTAPVAVEFPPEDFSIPPGPPVIHPRWHTFQPGPLPPFGRPRGSRGRPRPRRAFRTARTVATEILLADAARNRLRKLVRRNFTRAPPCSPTVTHGTMRYHALPYGSQPSTLFDISVPWDALPPTHLRPSSQASSRLISRSGALQRAPHNSSTLKGAINLEKNLITSRNDGLCMEARWRARGTR